MNKFLWCDVETGGLDPKVHCVHQVSGQVIINGKLQEEFDLKFRFHPDAEVQKEALKVSNLTQEQVDKRKLSSEDAYHIFNNILCTSVDKYDKQDKFIFCAYNANFDAQFLNQWFQRHGNKYFFGLCHGGAYFDPLNLALLAEMSAGKKLFNPNRKLGTVAKELGVPLDNAHDALADIRATREVGKRLWEIIRRKS